MRTPPYEMNDPKDFSMIQSPSLLIGDIVMIFDAEDGPGEWAQARVFAAQFNRYAKRWEYEASLQIYDIDGGQDNGLTDRHWVLFNESHVKASFFPKGEKDGVRSVPVVVKEAVESINDFREPEPVAEMPEKFSHKCSGCMPEETPSVKMDDKEKYGMSLTCIGCGGYGAISTLNDAMKGIFYCEPCFKRLEPTFSTGVSVEIHRSKCVRYL